MENVQAGRFADSSPRIARSSGTGEADRSKSQDPALAELREARKAWESDVAGGEGKQAKTGARIADAGDAGGYVAPYDIETETETETEADSVGGQSPRKTNEAE